MRPDLPVLLARARAHDPEAVNALADLVEIAAVNAERRVGAALGLGRRGGVSARHAALIAERDDALRVLASIIAPGLAIGQQAREIAARLGGIGPRRRMPREAAIDARCTGLLELACRRRVYGISGAFSRGFKTRHPLLGGSPVLRPESFRNGIDSRPSAKTGSATERADSGHRRKQAASGLKATMRLENSAFVPI